MKLKDFPLVTKAFKDIEVDSGGFHRRRIKMKADVPQRWINRFLRAEQALTKIHGKKLRDFHEYIPEKKWNSEILQDGDFKPTESAWIHVIIPCNENDKILLKAAGAVPVQIKAAREVLNGFFDGDLNLIFAGWSGNDNQ